MKFHQVPSLLMYSMEHRAKRAGLRIIVVLDYTVFYSSTVSTLLLRFNRARTVPTAK